MTPEQHWWVLAASVALAGITAAALFWSGVGPFTGADAGAYLDAARSYLAGGSIYDTADSAGRFGFIYPPFAMLGFLVLAPLPTGVAIAGWQTASLLMLVPLFGLLLRAAGVRLEAWWWPFLALASLVWYPVGRALVAGQIDLVLVTLVAVDFFVLRKTRWRGVLIGLAAGVKLTPAVYGLTLLLERDWRALARAAASGGLTVVAGFIVLPQDSLRYWGDLAGVTARSGDQGQGLSQSWAALIARLTHPVSGYLTWPWSAVWLVLVIATILIGVGVIRRMLERRLLIVAVGVNALVGLLISPLSSLHHWVAVLPLLVALGVAAVRTRSVRLWAWLFLGLVLSGIPPWWYLGTWRGWGPAAALVGSALVFWGAATVLLVNRWRDVLAAALQPRSPAVGSGDDEGDFG
ncbi:MAG: glycosyltransferase 87 family protein [Propioniciclava sp.]